MVLSQLLGIAHRHALLRDRLRENNRIRRGNQGTRVSSRQASIRQHVADRIGKLQQPKAVGHMTTALADDLTQIILGVAMLGNQLLIAKRFFEGIEVGTLDVFDNGKFESSPVIDITDNDRNLDEPGQLGRTPTAFAGNDLEAVSSDSANDDRLHDPMLANGTGEILQLGFIEITAGISGTASDELDWNGTIRIDGRPRFAGGNRLIHFTDQRCQAAPEAAFRYVFAHTHTLVRRLRGFSLPLALDDLGSQLKVCLATGAFQIIKDSRLTIRRSFGYPNIAGDQGRIDLLTEMLADIAHHLLS